MPKPPDHYNPAAGAHARRDFAFRGVSYLRGDTFPFETIGLKPDKVAILWRARRISFGPAPAAWVSEAADRRMADLEAKTKPAAKVEPAPAKAAPAPRTTQPASASPEPASVPATSEKPRARKTAAEGAPA